MNACLLPAQCRRNAYEQEKYRVQATEDKIKIDIQKEKEKVLYEQLIKDPNHPNSISEMMGTSFHAHLGELKMCL